jgi:hypothetical protein
MINKIGRQGKDRLHDIILRSSIGALTEKVTKAAPWCNMRIHPLLVRSLLVL